MNDAILKKILDEFRSFEPPVYFAGGCIKSKIDGFCCHLKQTGDPGKVEENCKDYKICVGFNFKYNVK